MLRRRAKVFRYILVIAVILIGFGWLNKQRKAYEMYSQVNDYIENYPSQPEPYIFTELYLRDDTYEYLVLQTNGNTITGVRSENGETIYCVNGEKWYLSEKESNMEILPLDVDILETIVQIVSAYAERPDISYSYKEPVSSCPIGTKLFAPYLLCTEKSPDPEHEIMSITEDNPCLRWYRMDEIGYTLVLHACSMPDNGDSFYADLWGELPEEISSNRYKGNAK